MDEDELLAKYRLSLGLPTPQEAARIELELEIQSAALEVGSKFTADLQLRLNKITAPNDVRGIAELFRSLGMYVVFARMGNFKARLQEKQRIGLEPLRQAIRHGGEFKNALQKLSDVNLTGQAEHMLSDLDDWLYELQSIERSLKKPIRGRPGLPHHRILIIALANSWRETKGESPSAALNGPFFRYVDALLEIIPPAYRPKVLELDTMSGWIKQYRKQVAGKK